MSTEMTCTKLTILTVAGIFLQIIGLSIFVFGFFPVKPTLSGVSGSESYRHPLCDSAPSTNESEIHPEKLRLLYQELSGISSRYDRLILMVIDGLPAEFVLGKDGEPPLRVWKDSMPYTQSLLANGDAIGYHAKAAPPTVTMPRLKAMVSGAIGGFLDVAFNFNTQALLDDNLLGQFFRIGWKMVMLGDETWLKLFPGIFMRHDGVSSFFVKDTVQIDKNVSRHLPNELNNHDWNLLILHYLGLDHVGHTGGRNSPLMASKLKEMDDIVRTMHLRAMVDRSHDEGQTLLIVVSDHGMTENGNHGGSSYEETDSLMLFIGLSSNVSDDAGATNNLAFQVDLTPTLALLFGVPIPKNNVGVLVPGTLNSLRDFEQLRALELNSWQLLRLLQAQLPSSLFVGFSCKCFVDGICEGFGSEGFGSDIIGCSGDKEKQLICLFRNCAVLHGIWKSKKLTESSSAEDFNRALDAYNAFLKTASEWLASKTTEKPVLLLGLGVSAMLVSCVVCVTLFLSLFKEVYNGPKDQVCSSKYQLNLEDVFILAVLLVLVISMGSSSMVEEEHYIWHFMVSTFYLLLLFKTVKSFSFSRGLNPLGEYKIVSIFLLLISGRLLRGWHQGGVNWTYFPDISKWLEQAGGSYVKWVQLISSLLVICLGLFTLFRTGPKRKSVRIQAFVFSISGFLILLHAWRYQGDMFGTDNGATLTAKVIYLLLSISAVGEALVLPWSMLNKDKPFLVVAGDCLNSIGSAYVLCWCLLQLLLQQPINSGPILLLLIQILSVSCLSSKDVQVNGWVEIAALYYMGMAGHFALGNSNTLATIDVAGAFMGISSHSTILSGILMFMITYASPLLFLLSLVMYIGARLRNHSHLAHSDTDLGQLLKLKLGFPCLVPLCINSILLTAYTVVLLLMSNHLFVWSVFSPKYLYVCATTVCTYIGVCIVAVTVAYTFSVTTFLRSKHNTKKQ